MFGPPRCFLCPSIGVVELAVFRCFWRSVMCSDLNMKRLLATLLLIKKPISSGMFLLFQCFCIGEERANFDFFCNCGDVGVVRLFGFRFSFFNGRLKVGSLSADNFVFDMIAAFTQFPILISGLGRVGTLPCFAEVRASFLLLSSRGVRLVGLSTFVGNSCMLLLAGFIKNFRGVFFFRVVGIFPLS